MRNSSIKIPFASFLLIFSLIFAAILAEEDQSKKSESEAKSNLNRPDVAICEGSSSAFFVSDNVNIRGANASASIRGVNEKECIDFCAKNQDHKRRTVLCASVVYESEVQECRMYRRASLPDGEMQRKAEEGRRYFEKFCLPDDAPAQCANRQFVRVDEYILKGYAQSTTTVPTMAECAAFCMREREFECKSAMYFYEEGECITNVESAITAPDDFQRPDDEDKVVFFHNGCILPGAGTIGQPGEFELAQSQDPASTIPPSIVPSAATSNGFAQQQEENGGSSTNGEGETTPFPSSPSNVGQENVQSTVQGNEEGQNLVANGNSSPLPSSPPLSSFSSSSSAMPDGADAIPSSSQMPAALRRENEEEEHPSSSSKPNAGGNEGSNAEIPAESSGENGNGQKLGELADEGSNGGLKAVPIPIPSSGDILPPKEGGGGPQLRLHPKQLALPPLDEAKLEEEEEKEGPTDGQQQQQRQYGAKTIERASDGSFQEKAAIASTSADNDAGNVPSASKPAGLAHANRKGPESTKRLHLKLIKDQQRPKPDITNISASSFSPSKPSESPQLATSTEQNGGNDENPSSSSSSSSTEGQPEQRQQQIVVVPQDESPEEHFQGAEGFFSRWGAWTPCHVPGERRVRRRKCLDLRRCKGALMQVDYCPRDIPPAQSQSDESSSLLEGQPQQQLLAAEQQPQPQLAPAIPVAQSDGPHPEVGGIPLGSPSSPASSEGPSSTHGGGPVPVNLSVGQMVGGGFDGTGGAQPPAIMPPSQEEEGKGGEGNAQQREQPIPAGAPAPRPAVENSEAAAIWSPWNGSCQHFASSQPCKDGQVIGFESRECIAKDPLACKGPFFRYCTLPC